ncbi:EF hand family protein [Aphelenchoides avenae]|nr:EF hand family protein [Aphelenchus avenae]
MDNGIQTNISPIFQAGPRISILNISPAALTETELKQRARRQVDLVSDPAEKLRYGLLSHGFAGIKEFARMLRTHGPTVSYGDLTATLELLDVKLPEETVEKAFLKFASSLAATAPYAVVVSAVKPSLNSMRSALVESAFARIDRKGKGVVTSADLKAVYDFRKHPHFMSGAKTREEVFRDFLINGAFDAHADGKITKEDFVNYYSAVSAGVDGDIYFDHIMRHTWGI